MTEPRSHLRQKHVRTERVQAHSASEVLDREVRFSKIAPHEAAVVPRPRQVRIEQERPVDQGGTRIKLTCYTSKHPSGHGERGRVVLAQPRRVPSKPRGFSRLLLTVDHPAIRLAPLKADRCDAIRGREISVELNGF